MKRFIPFLLVLFIACKSKMPDIPRGVIQPDKFKTIMSDVFIADALAETKGLAGVNEKKYTEQFYTEIFKKYGVSKDDYVRSYKFYESNPEWMNRIMDSVLDNISKREGEVGSDEQTGKK